MLTYADGSALSRSLVAELESVAWMRWSDANREHLVTSPVGLTELRRVADGLDVVARDKARTISAEITVVRLFDQALEAASMASGVLSPFGAIHLGIAVAHPEVEQVATYDPLLARVCVIYGLAVVTPGRPVHWWET